MQSLTSKELDDFFKNNDTSCSFSRAPDAAMLPIPNFTKNPPEKRSLPSSCSSFCYTTFSVDIFSSFISAFVSLVVVICHPLRKNKTKYVGHKKNQKNNHSTAPVSIIRLFRCYAEPSNDAKATQFEFIVNSVPSDSSLHHSWFTGPMTNSHQIPNKVERKLYRNEKAPPYWVDHSATDKDTSETQFMKNIKPTNRAKPFYSLWYDDKICEVKEIHEYGMKVMFKEEVSRFIPYLLYVEYNDNIKKDTVKRGHTIMVRIHPPAKDVCGPSKKNRLEGIRNFGEGHPPFNTMHTEKMYNKTIAIALKNMGRQMDIELEELHYVELQDDHDEKWERYRRREIASSYMKRLDDLCQSLEARLFVEKKDRDIKKKCEEEEKARIKEAEDRQKRDEVDKFQRSLASMKPSNKRSEAELVPTWITDRSDMICHTKEDLQRKRQQIDDRWKSLDRDTYDEIVERDQQLAIVSARYINRREIRSQSYEHAVELMYNFIRDQRYGSVNFKIDYKLDRLSQHDPKRHLGKIALVNRTLYQATECGWLIPQ